MKIPLNDILVIYENIIKDINVAEVSMILFTALDLDSLCTLKILANFLKNEQIEFKIYPVVSWGDLQQRIEDCKTYEKIKLFFFINCGGMIDLSAKWLTKQAQVFLFDVNRPIHHANIESPKIKIVDDQFGQLEKAPTNQQYEWYLNLEDEQIQQMAQRKHADQQQQEQDEQDQITARRRRRNRTSQQAKQKFEKMRKVKLQVDKKIRQYYSKQFFGLPSSYIAYKMIKQLNKSQNNYLWYAIVGLTGMYLQNKIQKQQFQQISEFFKTDLIRLNTVVYKQGQNVQKNSLKKKLDFQFPLLRHWSLYQSIMNSSYMIAHLGLWDQNGVKKLHQLLNLIGLSLQQSKQLFKYMLKASIQKLQSNIFTHASKPNFNILDVTFQSFAKQVDYAFEMSASDYYYAISTVLQKPFNKAINTYNFEHRIQCFWQAYNLFSANQTKLLAAIQEAKTTLQTYTKQSKNILQRNHIMNGSQFGFVNIYNDTEDRKLFEHPNSLTKFAYMLMIMNKFKKKKDRPLIASLNNNVTQTAQVVGIMNQSKNEFSSKFNSVITKLGIDVNYQCFMNNIMTISKDSLLNVIKQLSSM